MFDIQAPKPKAFQFARKALGLSQSVLAAEMGLKQETISRYETNALVAPTEYKLALAGLLCREERRLRGCDDDVHGRLLATGSD
jgi:DNA-binding XRE family transcriptional regulator